MLLMLVPSTVLHSPFHWKISHSSPNSPVSASKRLRGKIWMGKTISWRNMGQVGVSAQYGSLLVRR